ncbi:PrgI family protein [Patescibacteria group bacterium]|nr:PrgI family protein [Patescibacteria group bacterium]
MEQHPVPQHISSYQFRLVGDMTIRQFGMLAGGCIAGLIFYATPLAPYIKWPLIVFSITLGAALAFVPLQERPLDKWIVAFIKAIFSPTQFAWKKQPKELEIFKIAPQRKFFRKAPAPPADRKQLTEYLATLPAEPKSPLDQQEESFIKKTVNMFQLAKMPSPQPAVSIPPSWAPPVQPIPQAPRPAPQPKVVQPIKVKPAPPKKEEVVLPEKPGRPKKPQVEAKFEPGLPFPAPPSQPNTLVGMVLDQEGKIIEGAIIEIRDSQDIPVRALKTNKLGQFRSVTPLDNGQYEIEIEKEGYQFDILKIKLKGEVVEPLAIRAKGKTSEPAQNI